MHFPDQQVIYRIKDGDEAAFAELRTYFHVPAFKLCSHMLKNENEAEAVIKNVFDKIWSERVGLNAEGNFQSYLFLHLKEQIFGQMKKYQEPLARKQYLDRIHTLAAK